MGGPPLVLPNRVKVGGSDKNEEEKRNTSSSSTIPQPVKKKKTVLFISTNLAICDRLGIT